MSPVSTEQEKARNCSEPKQANDWHGWEVGNLVKGFYVSERTW